MKRQHTVNVQLLGRERELVLRTVKIGFDTIGRVVYRFVNYKFRIQREIYTGLTRFLTANCWPLPFVDRSASLHSVGK